MLDIIVNPVAGRGRARTIADRIKAILDMKNVAYRLHLSNYPGHAVALAREAAAAGSETVVAVGGDGTVAEVANGILGSQAKLGIIPAGTGNDYCRCLSIPMALEGALGAILSGRERRVDAIRLNDRIFMNIINAGFDNEVAVNAGRFKGLGKLAYLLSVFYTLPRYQGKHMRIVLDGQTIQQKAFMLVVGSGSHYGGGMFALPTADPSDGLLDVCLIDDVPAWQVVRLLPLFIKGKHVRLPQAHFFRCRHITVDGVDGELALGGDGEYIKRATPATISALPGALTVHTA